MEKHKWTAGRRKFFIVIGVFIFALGFLRDFFKNPKMAVEQIKGSMHPARFYRKLYSAGWEEKDAI